MGMEFVSKGEIAQIYLIVSNASLVLINAEYVSQGLN